MNDQQLIAALGGPAHLAETLGYDKARGGIQRVQNWVRRGIPAQVKLDHAAVFRRARRLEGAKGHPVEDQATAEVQ